MSEHLEHRQPAYGILMLLVLTEITSPCQNTWSIDKVRRNTSTAAENMVKGFIGPLFVYELVVFYAESLGKSEFFPNPMASKTVAKDIITLRGSAAIVSEFFGYAANRFGCWGFFFSVSILYNRGVYPEESFAKVKKYGLPMLLTHDEGVKSFIANLTSQLSEWLEAGKLQRVVLVIMSKSSSKVLERWNFSIQTDGEVVEKGVSREKSDKEIMREIQAIMRQIASSITYLPCLDEPCKKKGLRKVLGLASRLLIWPNCFIYVPYFRCI
ncbi:hypothetical protein SAY87_018010 [Trapa incisa]|uniref:HORMA domain-containing protein n=1 Tax=Trapa incisa TaxID=236973 RepID=A0AAN7KWT0_9MYRT|nr:hypothetical protein SAY87_018010 [Trapa incisa]